MKPEVKSPVWLPVPWGQDIYYCEMPFPTAGTQLDVFSGAFEYPFPWRFTVGPFDDRGFPKGEQGRREQSALETVVEETVVTDAVERWRQDVVQESPEKFLRLKSLWLLFSIVFAVDVRDGECR